MLVEPSVHAYETRSGCGAEQNRCPTARAHFSQLAGGCPWASDRCPVCLQTRGFRPSSPAAALIGSAPCPVRSLPARSSAFGNQCTRNLVCGVQQLERCSASWQHWHPWKRLWSRRPTRARLLIRWCTGGQHFRRGALAHVTGVDVDSQNRVWAFHRAERSVLCIDGDTGEMVSSFGDGPFDNEHGLHVDAAGNVWVADSTTHVVEQYSPESELLTTLAIEGEPREDEMRFNNRRTSTLVPTVRST